MSMASANQLGQKDSTDGVFSAVTQLQSSLPICELLQNHVLAPGVARGAAAGFRTLGDGATGAVGQAEAGSLFDLASLTKPCCALLAVKLAADGHLRLSSRLEELLPLTTGSPAGARSLEQHLSHRAGMLPHIELFRAAEAGGSVCPEELLTRAARASRPGGAPGEGTPAGTALYSDLGYLLVGRALETVTATPLDDLLRDVITGPLGLELDSARGWRRRSSDFLKRCLPTEARPERGGIVRGVVHDDNAWVIAGSGLCGHAGLFGTLDGVLALGHLLVLGARGSGPLAGLVELLIAPRPGGSLLLGLDGVSKAGTTAGSQSEERTFGHLGFTGTSFWCDPERGLVTALLTNRTYPSRRGAEGIRQARPMVHDGLRGLAYAIRASK